MLVGRNRMIWNLVARGAAIMLFAMVASVAVVAWISTDLPPDLYRRSLVAAFFIPMLISPPVSLIVGRLNFRNYLLLRKVEWLAEHDDMTGLLNRRAFQTRSAKILGQQDDSVQAQPVVLLLADIDHFKLVNDSLGHEAGDKAIQHVTRQLTKLSPDDAIIARLGGEEFAILTNWTTLADIRSLAESIRHSVEHTPCHFGDKKISLTLSLGVAIGSRTEKIGPILQRADNQLYTAKREGRNAFAIESHVAA